MSDPAWVESGNASLRAEEEEDKGDGKRERKENNFLFPGRENGRKVLKMRMFSYIPEITKFTSGHIGLLNPVLSDSRILQNSCPLYCNAM